MSNCIFWEVNCQKNHDLHQGGCAIVVFCLSVTNFAQNIERICTKFSWKVGNGPVNKWLNFSGNPDHGGMHCPIASK